MPHTDELNPTTSESQPQENFFSLRQERDDLLAQNNLLSEQIETLRKQSQQERPTRELPEANLQHNKRLQETRTVLKQIADSQQRRGPFPYTREYLEDLAGRLGGSSC